MNIQREIIGNTIFGVTEPLFNFTFLATPVEQDPFTRMEEMTRYIRDTLVAHYHYGLMDPHTFIVEWFPYNAFEHRLQRTFGRIGTMTADVFLELFEAMLQSDETLELTGMRITVQHIGSQMNHQIYGAGRTPGSKWLPARLKNKGVFTHSLEGERTDILQQVKLCGILALLLLRDKKYLEKSRFWDWIEDAKRLGVTVGVEEDGIVRNHHFQELIQQPGWEKQRIVVFGINHALQAVFVGPEW